ncbi:CGNR zinc finger domain-containing protein [Pseudomonas citronellolis]|uniref:CGNR zinc finger domain-containing protein n=1 Tax=Pseudomonas citronellolis TaxID=53408 RepID=UPI0023E36F29|nr:ABATE domain-containing protein [Pseudomonas citronellolis]MDF3932089.1 CGNR zinc finger domain-containing protein [Pseudomonas citronellolis]
MREPTPQAPYLIADHLALDMLNSLSRTDAGANETSDAWHSDADVLAWLRLVGLPTEPAEFAEGALLAAAVELREVLRDLVERRKRGEAADPARFNAFLRRTASYPQLEWHGEHAHLHYLAVERGAEQLLAPLAEQGALLLAEGDFGLVRVCEHPDCTLWFYDRTKSHRRRWCSMALCGNRHKVAEHRKRQREADA